MTEQPPGSAASRLRDWPTAMGSWTLVLAGLYLAMRESYLLFHSLAELFSIVVGCSTFVVIWSARSMGPNPYLQLLGISYLFVAGLDLLHTMAYKGMGVFHGVDANLPTQLWISARYMEGLSFLGASLLAHLALPFGRIFFWYSLATAAIIGWIFSLKSFPDCFVEGQGLTAFKISSEYLISGILLVSAFNMRRRNVGLEPRVVRWLVAAMLITEASEMSLTLYRDVYGFFNMLGHYTKILSFFLIFKAVVQTAVVSPHETIFTDLKASQEALARERDHLKKALAEVKTLQSLLPICSHCKKVRDDKGYWRQIEEYITAHSHTKFTHGICPECLARHYPDYQVED